MSATGESNSGVQSPLWASSRSAGGTPVSNLYDGSVSVGDSQHQHAQGATPSRCFHSAECARISMTTLHTAMPSLRSRCHVSHADFTVLESCLPCAQIYQRLSCCRCEHASGACLSLRSSLCNVSEQQEAVEAALCDAESMLRVTPRYSTGRGAALWPPGYGRRAALLVLHAGHSVRHPAAAGRVRSRGRGRDSRS